MGRLAPLLEAAGLAFPWEIGEASADNTEGGGSEMGVLVLASTVRSRVAAASSSMEAGLLKQHWIP